MDSTTLISLSLCVAAVGLAALALPLVGQWRQRHRAERTIDAALSRQAAAATAPARGAASAPANAAAAQVQSAGARIGARLGGQLSKRFDQRWLASPLGKTVVTAEEERLLEQCGFYGDKARAVFGGLRLSLPAALAAAVFAGHLPASLMAALFWAFATFALGFLAPKWMLRRRAQSRLRRLEDELPVLVDMLRLLQGVGLSIDQSLQIIVAEFGSMLRVLGPELTRANQQFASGRSREQTLQRIGRLFDSEDLRSLTTMLSQVDRFGGAVQEPLRQFGLRLQEGRKSRMKEQVGKLTVKMTAVMVVTMLPVLLIITAGPGFLGVMRMLSHMSGGLK
ncbi:type II secretion system F family protein [Cupriavidus basilensis]|uniref:Type II secretion system F family protein n=1 Tax=Cupriavidus basilensis TaxID=68895 RepID=A0ABT6AWI6_9BURK|nr:type II secretion system F family protein [Cupriavidus basilensis]MDF3836993.1 type II secretion system F family protein [Cupriavidus basilensis]